ncbi:hypothetical protein FKM82_021082, partial [Ascaphus truei]
MFSTPGDYVIGGLFPIHSDILYLKNEFQVDVPICTNFYAPGYQHLLAMKYAVHEINNSTSLLPNVTLGYDLYDTCSDSLVSVRAALGLVLQNPTGYTSRVVAVIHPGSSDAILGGARLLNFVPIPQVSYSPPSESMTLGSLSFFRTAPSSKSQAEALVKLVTHFHWNWISVLASNDPYGRSRMEHFTELATASETCIAYRGLIPTRASEKEISKIMDNLKNSHANVTVLFASDASVEKLMRALIQRNITGKVWVADDGWSTSDMIASIPNLVSLGTFIGFAVRSGHIPGFREYVEGILKDKTSDPAPIQDRSNEGDIQLCLECQNLTLANATNLLGSSSYRRTFNAYAAVYIIANALHQLLCCNQSACLCDMSTRISPWQLMEEMIRVNVTIDSTPIYISNTGDPPAAYELITWKWKSISDSPDFQVIGSYDSIGNLLKVNSSLIQWHVEGKQITLSNCSQQCEPGQRRQIQHYCTCCYLCENCPTGYFQNMSADPSTCTPCLRHQWSSEMSTQCHNRVIEYLDWKDTITIVMTSLGSLILLFIAFVFVTFTAKCCTPIVKATGWISSLVLLVSLAFSLFSCHLFIGKPNAFRCLVRQPIFSGSFTVCLALLLGKSLEVSNLCGSRSACFQGCITYLCLLLSLLAQVGLCWAWFYWDPPSVLENSGVSASSLVIECKEGSFTGFGLLLFFNGFLALLCFMCTFLGQSPSQKLNQAKQITYAMLIYFVAWIFFIPTYATSKGKLVPLFQIFSGIISASGILGFYFLPKCYILLFQPQINTQSDSEIPQQE